MSGHSKWAGIKHKKAIIDSKRGKVFTKLGREITVAAKEGGGNPEHNARLRKAIDDARQANMPQENVKRAIQRGTGELPGITIEEILYEGYGPGGAAILVQTTTDSRNRTNSEIRKIFSNHNGNMAEIGAVAWMFSLKGYIIVEKGKVEEETLLNLVLESGAEDMKASEDDCFEIFTAPEDFEKVKATLESHQIPIANAELSKIPQNTVPLEGKDAENVLALVDELEEHDDVSQVYSNFDVPKEMLNPAS